MTDIRSEAADDHVLDVLMARAGISPPDDRRAGVLAGFRELSAMAAMMRQPRDASAEPAIVFDLAEVLRAE
ncbi:hypothetical protein QQG74_02405 [Micromonospora sp. FIMYZ51]|uniref:hypothetical protein n=1 Tax=Micromonospora sp. FIMYZ51 TaxID=3051832 RepID=UPI00311EF975